MKRGQNDVAWSVIAQGFKCLWCAQPAIETSPGDFMCANDPQCFAAKLEEEIEKNKNALLRTMNA